MGVSNPEISSLITMSEAEFCRFGEFIHTKCGIKLPPSKKTMLEARLQKRLRCLGIKSFHDYGNYVFSQPGMKDELVHMIDAVTTNKTDFFREPHCFDFLVQVALPELVVNRKPGTQEKFMVWSAGCSSGEEPYTLAMVLSEYAGRYPGFHFSILATDISTKALKTAIRAVYEEARVEPVPLPLPFNRKYLMVSKDKREGMVRIVPELRTLVKFQRLNFMDGDFGIPTPMDVIFCRNVLIYFDKKTQEELLNHLCRHLVPGGYLAIGHAEVITDADIPLKRVAQSVYRKDKRG